MKKFYKVSLACMVASLAMCIAHADTLPRAIMHTLQTNPDILIKVKGWQASEQEIRQAQGGYYPKFDITARVAADRTKNNNSDFTYNEEIPRGFGITMRQLIFDGFLTTSEVSRTKNKSLADKYQVQGTANDIALLASKAYLDVLTTAKVVDLANSNYAAHQRIYSMIQSRADTGIGRKADISQASGRLALAKTNLLAAQNNYMDAKATYYKIVGTTPDNLVYPDEPRDSNLPITANSALHIATSEHPLIKSANADIAETIAQNKAAKSAYYPRLDAVVHDSNDKDIAGTAGNYGNQYAGLELSYNVYNGGSDMAHDKATAYYVEQAQKTRDLTYTQVVENMKLSWNALATAKSQLAYLKQHQNAAQETVYAYNQQFQLNKRTLLDLLNAQNEVFQAKTDYVNGTASIILSKFRVLNAEGALVRYFGVPVTISAGVQQPAPITLRPAKILIPITPPTTTGSSSYDVSSKHLSSTALGKYTIQLYSSYDKNDAINFITKNNLQNQAAFYQTKYLGQTKYDVVYGIYPSSDEALKKLRSLPNNMRSWNPIIKPLSNVQTEISG